MVGTSLGLALSELGTLLRFSVTRFNLPRDADCRSRLANVSPDTYRGVVVVCCVPVRELAREPWCALVNRDFVHAMVCAQRSFPYIENNITIAKKCVLQCVPAGFLLLPPSSVRGFFKPTFCHRRGQQGFQCWWDNSEHAGVSVSLVNFFECVTENSWCPSVSVEGVGSKRFEGVVPLQGCGQVTKESFVFAWQFWSVHQWLDKSFH